MDVSMNDLSDEFLVELWDDILTRPHMQLRNLKLDKIRMSSEGIRNFARRLSQGGLEKDNCATTTLSSGVF